VTIGLKAVACRPRQPHYIGRLHTIPDLGERRAVFAETGGGLSRSSQLGIK
jgi:hypothetical protein